MLGNRIAELDLKPRSKITGVVVLWTQPWSTALPRAPLNTPSVTYKYEQAGVVPLRSDPPERYVPRT